MGIIDLIMGWGVIGENTEVAEEEYAALTAIDKKEKNKAKV